MEIASRNIKLIINETIISKMPGKKNSLITQNVNEALVIRLNHCHKRFLLRFTWKLMSKTPMQKNPIVKKCIYDWYGSIDLNRFQTTTLSKELQAVSTHIPCFLQNICSFFPFGYNKYYDDKIVYCLSHSLHGNYRLMMSERMTDTKCLTFMKLCFNNALHKGIHMMKTAHQNEM